MAIGVKGAVNRTNQMGFNVTTSDAKATAVLTTASIAEAGYNKIFKIRIETTGENCWLLPATNIDDLASDAASGQADVIVTNVGRFAAGDWILIMEDDYATHEFLRVASVATGTSTLTMASNLVSTYHTADNSQLVVVPNKDSYIPLTVGYILNEGGMNWEGFYVRRMGAPNVTVKGYAVMV